MSVNISMNRSVLLRSLFLLCLSLCMISGTYSQEEPVKKSKTYLYLDAYQSSDGGKKLVATLKTKVDKKFVLMNEQDVSFVIRAGDSTFNLGETRTNNEGIASLEISGGDSLPVDENGFYRFEAIFKGDNLHKSKTAKEKIKDIVFSSQLREIDSVKYVKIEAYEFDLDRNQLPIDDVDVEIFVQRMFSQLKVGEVTLENGKGEFEFPNDIPGDSIGRILIYVKINDHKYFGNVEQHESIAWGTAVTERESFKSSFKGGEYIAFMLISLIIAVLVVGFSRKKIK